jgi:hypothetical protein
MKRYAAATDATLRSAAEAASGHEPPDNPLNNRTNIIAVDSYVNAQWIG